MALVSSKNNEQVLMRKWWVRALVALLFAGLAYGFASLAIDSGNLLEYAITIGFVWWAFHNAIRAARLVFAR